MPPKTQKKEGNQRLTKRSSDGHKSRSTNKILHPEAPLLTTTLVLTVLKWDSRLKADNVLTEFFEEFEKIGEIVPNLIGLVGF